MFCLGRNSEIQIPTFRQSHHIQVTCFKHEYLSEITGSVFEYRQTFFLFHFKTKKSLDLYIKVVKLLHVIEYAIYIHNVKWKTMQMDIKVNKNVINLFKIVQYDII